MRFNTEIFRKYNKVFSNLDGGLIFLEPTENKVYANGIIQSVVLNCTFEDVKDDEKKVYAIDKKDFMHTVEFSETLNMKSDYSYEDDKHTIKGTFKAYEDDASRLNHIKNVFVNEDNFQKSFESSEEMFRLLNRASIFVNPTDIKVSFRNLNIKNKYISASSDYKCYVSPIDIDGEFLISADTLKFISIFGKDVEIFKNESQEYLLKFEDGMMYFNAPTELDYLPIDGKFQQSYSSVMNKTVIKVNPKELIDKLGFISYYASSVPSSCVILKNEGDKILLCVGDTSTTLDVTSIESSEEGDLILPFNSNALINVISKLATDDDITISVSKDSMLKLFVLNFVENENIIFAKLNI